MALINFKIVKSSKIAHIEERLRYNNIHINNLETDLKLCKDKLTSIEIKLEILINKHD